MRISDWSSDVCSSDLRWVPHGHPPVSAWTVLEDTGLDIERARKDRRLSGIVAMLNRHAEYMQTTETRATPTSFVNGKPLRQFGAQELLDVVAAERSEARRVGKECVSTCRSRWSPYH